MSYIFARSAAQAGLLSSVLNSSRPLRNLLVLIMGIGIVLFFPGRGGLRFHPEVLILVFFPIFVIIFCWMYVRLVSTGFKVISRDIPETALENETIEIILEIKYDGPIPFANVSLMEDFPATDILESPELILQYKDFDRNGIARVAYKNILNRGYGDFTIGPVHIVARDPIGFFEKKLVFQIKSKIKVWLNPPPPAELDLIKENALTPMGDSRSTQSGHGMDFYGIKEYVPGDDIRAMSWLKTAQTGKPVIKLFERDSRPDVMVAVHTDKQQVRGFGFGNTMKRLLRIAAAIMVETQKHGLPSSLGLNIEDEAHLLKLNSSIPVYGFMTDLLAGLQPAGESGLKQLIDLVLTKAGPGSIVIFLSQTMHLDMDLLLGALLNLKARGAKVSLWITDDTSMVRFSEDQQNLMTKEEFKSRMDEMDLDFLLLPSKRKATHSS